MWKYMFQNDQENTGTAAMGVALVSWLLILIMFINNRHYWKIGDIKKPN